MKTPMPSRVCFVALLLLPIVTAHAQMLDTCSKQHPERGYGKFSGRIVAEFEDDGRNVKIVRGARYTDPCRGTWDVPVGDLSDGATIPQWAWSFIGGPFEDKYRDAAFVHDHACDEKTRTWQLTHEAFFYAMRARGTAPWKAKVMYAAVYHFGPRWPDPTTHSLPPNTALKQEDFKQLADTIHERETGIGGFERAPMSLTEIEAWTPPKQ